MRIGISCYSTFGGSGVVATEVGKALAARARRGANAAAPTAPNRLRRPITALSMLVAPVCMPQGLARPRGASMTARDLR